MGCFLPVQIYEVRIMPPTSSFLFGMEELRCHHSILTSEKLNWKLTALLRCVREVGSQGTVPKTGEIDTYGESPLTRAGTHKQKFLWKIKQCEFSKKHRFILNPDCLSTKHVLFT